MRIGIDVGGTNTDAVLMDGHSVVGWAKSPTTRDVSSGITNVLTALLAQTKVTPASITAVMCPLWWLRSVIWRRLHGAVDGGGITSGHGTRLKVVCRSWVHLGCRSPVRRQPGATATTSGQPARVQSQRENHRYRRSQRIQRRGADTGGR